MIFHMYAKIASSVCTNIVWAFEFMAFELFLHFLLTLFCHKINHQVQMKKNHKSSKHIAQL
jgi:hypothetical protein